MSLRELPGIDKLLPKVLWKLQSKKHGPKYIESIGHKAYVGGYWNEMGLLQLDYMKSLGLTEQSLLWDIGCGSLRGGQYFINYLDSQHYIGWDKEPALLEKGILFANASKSPRLFTLSHFNFHQSAPSPDFALAHSVFTHLNHTDISLCLGRLRERVKTYTTFAFTFFEGPYSHMNPKESRDHMAFYYTQSEFQQIALAQGWEFQYIGDFGHPKNQMLAVALPIA